MSPGRSYRGIVAFGRFSQQVRRCPPMFTESEAVLSSSQSVKDGCPEKVAEASKQAGLGVMKLRR